MLGTLPAGNFKLQTLRRYFQLPERSAHSADGDVWPRWTSSHKSSNLLQNALTSLLGMAWLRSRKKIGIPSDSRSENSRTGLPGSGGGQGLPFLAGMHSSSDNERSRKMGSWYLAHLDTPPQEPYIWPLRIDLARMPPVPRALPKSSLGKTRMPRNFAVWWKQHGPGRRVGDGASLHTSQGRPSSRQDLPCPASTL